MVGVLWCVALLALVVVSVLRTSQLDLVLAKHHGDDVQARFLALAGVEKAKALLAAELRQSKRAARNPSSALEDSPAQFQDVALGRGRFSVRHRDPERSGWRYGFTDESARLALNVAPTNELIRIPGLTLDIAAAIVDWRDGDNAVGTGGAEVEYYSSLQPPHMVRNGPFQTVRELLMVRGVTPVLLSGRDRTRKGDVPSGTPGDTGWEDLLTAHSVSAETSVNGEDRVNVQTADEKTLAAVRGFTPEIAKAIVARRGQNPIATLLDLLDVPAAPAPGGAGPGGGPVDRGGGGNPGGPKVISETLLQDVADNLATGEGDGARGVGLVNVNTAGLAVLSCLPGVEPTLAQAIISRRASAGPFAHPIALLKVDGMDRERLKALLPRITTRSETYRIHAEGTVPGRGNRRHIETVVRATATGFTTLAYREDDL